MPSSVRPRTSADTLVPERTHSSEGIVTPAYKIHSKAVNVDSTLKEIGAGYAPTSRPIKFEFPLCAVEIFLTVRLS